MGKKRAKKRRKFGISWLMYIIQTLPEDFIVGSQMLVIPTLWVLLFLKILLFSHRF